MIRPAVGTFLAAAGSDELPFVAAGGEPIEMP